MNRLERAISLVKAMPEKIVGSKGKIFESSSPKATGTAGNFTIPGTKVHSYSHENHPSSWGANEHAQAMYAHLNHAASMSHPKLIQHHQNAAAYHKKMALGVKKAHTAAHHLYLHNHHYRKAQKLLEQIKHHLKRGKSTRHLRSAVKEHARRAHHHLHHHLRLRGHK